MAALPSCRLTESISTSSFERLCALQVTDLGSTNGTFVDGKELKAMEAVSCPGSRAGSILWYRSTWKAGRCGDGWLRVLRVACCLSARPAVQQHRNLQLAANCGAPLHPSAPLRNRV